MKIIMKTKTGKVLFIFITPSSKKAIGKMSTSTFFTLEKDEVKTLLIRLKNKTNIGKNIDGIIDVKTIEIEYVNAIDKNKINIVIKSIYSNLNSS